MSPVIFTLLLIYSTCFRHYYVHLQEFATMLLNYHIGCIVLGLLCVGVRVRFMLGWYPGCRLKHNSASAGSPDTTLAELHCNSNTQQPKNNTANVVVQQHSRKLLKIDILMPETC